MAFPTLNPEAPNNDGTIDSDNSGEDQFEESDSGVILCVDREGDVGSLDHLVEARLTFDSGLTAGTLTLEASSGGSRFRLWTDASKTSPVSLPASWYLAAGSPPSSLWVDGVCTGSVVLDLYYKDSAGTEVCRDKVAAYVTKTVSRSPAGTFAYSWEPCAWSYNGGVYTVGSDEAMARIKDQGWDVTVARYMIPSYSWDAVGPCTMANLKGMRLGGFVIVDTHGSPDSVCALYLSTEANINAWINGESDMVASASGGVPGRWTATVSALWFASNWQSDLDANAAITFWIACDSGTWGTSSIAACAGGRSKLGYDGTTCGGAAMHDSEGIFGRMNGSVEAGSKRSLHEAWRPGGYDHMSDGADYTIVKFGNDWTTLCPSPTAVFPRTPAGPRKGWGCIIFDTYMDDSVAASTVLTQTAGSCSVSNIRWLDNGSGKYAIGFDFDNTTGGGATMSVDASNCENKAAPSGVNLGRKLDGNCIEPNGDDPPPWSF